MKLLIVGRSGTGKDALRIALERRDISFVKSTTTRPKRSDDEDTHRFVTHEQAEAELPHAVATTVINGEHYYATEKQMMLADAYIIDPRGVFELIENMPDTAFRIAYIASDEDERRMMAVSRAEDQAAEAKVYDARSADENEQFSDFEAIIDDDKLTRLPENVISIYRFVNDYQPETLEFIADEIASAMRLQKNVYDALRSAIEKKLFYNLSMESEDKVRNDESQDTSSLDLLAEKIAINSEMLFEFTRAMLSNRLMHPLQMTGTVNPATRL